MPGDAHQAEAQIHYAHNGGVAIAYQVVGHGSIDLVYVPDWVSNLVYGWETPRVRDFYLRLADSFRLILFDKRGTGISDHGGQFATLETRMEDLHAVLDSAGSQRPVIFAADEGSGMAALFAASYPERTRALVVFHPPEPGGRPITEEYLREQAELRQGWGTQEWSDLLIRERAPSLADSEDQRRWFANNLRLGASPSVAYALNRAALETDLQELWPAVHVPTLFLYRSPQEAVTLDVASRVPGAIAMRVPGIDLDIDVNPEEIVEEIERFVRGEDAPQVPESILTTIMFTDIVGSTEHAAGLGDRAWRDLVSRHHALVRRELSRYRGHERDTAGDGFFATFDGPARAIGAARAISAGVRTLGLEVRIGIHVGECEVHEDKLAGLAVVIGARIASKAVGGEVLVSQTVRDLVAGSGIKLLDRGAHRLKGVPGTWRLFEVAADEV
jgi:class 3 adenylate cyclase